MSDREVFTFLTGSVKTTAGGVVSLNRGDPIPENITDKDRRRLDRMGAIGTSAPDPAKQGLGEERDAADAYAESERARIEHEEATRVKAGAPGPVETVGASPSDAPGAEAPDQPSAAVDPSVPEDDGAAAAAEPVDPEPEEPDAGEEPAEESSEAPEGEGQEAEPELDAAAIEQLREEVDAMEGEDLGKWIDESSPELVISVAGEDADRASRLREAEESANEPRGDLLDALDEVEPDDGTEEEPEDEG